MSADAAWFFDLAVEPGAHGDESLALRFKVVRPAHVVTHVRYAAGGPPAVFRVIGLDEAGEETPARALDVEDSSDGVACLVHGGLGGLRLEDEATGAERFEPYLLLAIGTERW